MLKRLESTSPQASGGSELAQGYAELLTVTATAQSQVLLLEAQLEGITDANLVQAPVLAQKPSQSKKGLIAIGARLATEMALLFVFIPQGLVSTTSSNKSSAKMLRIRNVFRLN